MTFDTSLYQIIEFNYDKSTRILSLISNNGKPPDRYGGATVDENSVLLRVKGLPADISDAWFEFAVSVVKKDRSTFRPVGYLLVDENDAKWRYYIVEQAVLAAAFKLRKLPIQLMVRIKDVTICSRNQITLCVNRGINALGTVRECYNNMMFKGDSWTWSADRVYHEGAVVTYDDEIYISTANNNVGNKPSSRSFYWTIPGVSKGAKFRPVSIPFACTEEGQETHWELTHGLGTMNFVCSIRTVGTEETSCEYVNAAITALPDRNTVYVDFSQPKVGRYILNMIPCKDTEIYDQKEYLVNPTEKITNYKFESPDQQPLPKYIQIYDRSITWSTEGRETNEFYPMIFQNSEEGFKSTDLYFFSGVDTSATELIDNPMKDLYVDAIFISPADTNVRYFSNIGYSQPAVIGSVDKRYLVQLYDMDTDERIFGKITQDGTSIKIELNSDRNFVAVLIEPTEVIRVSEWDRDWVHPLEDKYGGRPVAVQCIGEDNTVVYPRIYTDSEYAIATFDDDDGMRGYMLICGKLRQ